MNLIFLMAYCKVSSETLMTNLKLATTERTGFWC